MLKIIIVQVLFILSLVASAQEGLILKPMEQDSAQMAVERQIEYQQLISGQIPNELMLGNIKLPDFDYKTEYSKKYSINSDIYSFNNLPLADFSLGMMSPFYSPFYQNGTVLNAAAYKVGGKFTFGGFSYGMNSMMMPPPVPGINNFNRYGSTMFMQYKVSKNFKIETRVNVSQGGMYPGF